MLPATLISPDASRDDLIHVLERYWGYTSFRPLQREAMDAILARRDSVVVLPTGGGKSLCFQAPALVRPGLGVVVSPLISLMKDQVDTLVGNGVPAALYNSTLTAGREDRSVGRTARGAIPAAVRLARAPCRRGERWIPGDAVASATCSSSPSTRRIASASGATTSGRSIASWAGCAACFRTSASTLHGDGDGARPARHRRAARAEATPRSSSGRSIGRTSSTACWRAPA